MNERARAMFWLWFWCEVYFWLVDFHALYGRMPDDRDAEMFR